MANVLILDDEPITLRRLFNVLSKDRQHKLWTADNLVEGVRVVEKLGSTLDLLVIDVSMFQTSAIELLDLFASACPHAKVLAVSPTRQVPFEKGYSVLRKPFTDKDLLAAVNRDLALTHEAVAAHELSRKRAHQSSCLDGRSVRVRAATQ